MGVSLQYSNDGKMYRYIDTPPVEKPQKGKSVIERLNDYVVIDIETTGLDSDYCNIIELGAVKVVNGEIVKTFSSLIKPTKWFYSDVTDNEDDDFDGEDDDFKPLSSVSGYYYVDDFITRLTGITDEMLEDAPEPADILPKFKGFVGDSVIVGHNVSFDINFIYTAFERELKVPFTNSFVDTMRLSRKLFPDKQHHRLSDTAEYCGVEYAGAHRALTDSTITQTCYSAMLDKIAAEYSSFDDFKALFNRKSKSIDIKSIAAQTDIFDEEHPFYNKTVVFTGALEMPRKEAMQAVVNVGAKTANNVTKSTNYLVVGSFDYVSHIKGGKSSKIKKAEQMQLDGYDISVISENTFKELLANE